MKDKAKEILDYLKSLKPSKIGDEIKKLFDIYKT